VNEVIAFIREHTLCKLGKHCPPRKRIQKFDGGRLPQLCCYCRLIVDWKGTDRRIYLHRSTEEEQ
jgi:hypothetical protein